MCLRLRELSGERSGVFFRCKLYLSGESLSWLNVLIPSKRYDEQIWLPTGLYSGDFGDLARGFIEYLLRDSMTLQCFEQTRLGIRCVFGFVMTQALTQIGFK